MDAVRTRLGRALALLFAISLPLAAQAATPLPPVLARQELAINVRGETRGNHYAYPGDNPKLTKQRVLGRGPRLEDVRQGYLNNCFFVGTLGAIADAQPQHIEKLFLTRRNGALALDEQGRASLRFFHRGDKGLVKETVKVTAGLVFGKDGRPVFSKVRNGKLWAPLIEKGYATLLSNHGRIKGFASLDQGGAPRDVIEAITGEQSRFLAVQPTKQGADQAWKVLQAAIAKREIVVAGSLAGSDLRTRRSEAIASGLLGGRARRYTLDGQRLVADHDQTVLGVSVKNGVRTVRLRNPWGAFVPRGSGRKDGVYTIPLEKFVLFFDGITYSGRAERKAS